MYELLPPPRELFPSTVEYPATWNLYDAQAWGVSDLRQDYLDNAWAFHHRLANADPQIEIFQIAGCHKRTLSRIRCLHKDFMGKRDYRSDYQDSGDGAGDGIVPLWSVQGEGIVNYYVETTHEALAYDGKVIEGLVALVHNQEPDLACELPESKGFVERLGPEPLMQRVAGLGERLEKGTFTREDLKSFLFRE